MFSVLPLWKIGRRQHFFFFFLNGRRTHFPKQPAGLFFQDGRQTCMTIFTANGKVDAGVLKYKMRSFYITCNLFLKKKKKKKKKSIKIFGKRSYFSCVFNSEKKEKKKAGGLKKGSGRGR